MSATSLRAGVAIAVDAMSERIEDLETKYARVCRENGRLLDELHEANETIKELRAMNERAREDA